MKIPSDRPHIAYFDGATLYTNPGIMGIGAILTDYKGTFVDSISKKLDMGTNNVSEWRALLAALELATKHGIKNLLVCGDSALVINQAKGFYKIKAPHLRQFKEQEEILHAEIGRVRYKWIARAENREADLLSKACFVKLIGEN
jgi:ribonuclease HI